MKIPHGSNWLSISSAQYEMLKLACRPDGMVCVATKHRTARKLLELNLIQQINTPGEVSVWIGTPAGEYGCGVHRPQVLDPESELFDPELAKYLRSKETTR